MAESIEWCLKDNVEIDVAVVFATNKAYQEGYKESFCKIIKDLCLTQNLLVTVAIVCLENVSIYENLEDFTE